MEIASLVISILALIATGIIFLVHDNKIKKQEKRINEYQIQKIEGEIQDSKKAIIEANVFKVKDYKNAIRIYNKGHGVARNVVVGFPEMDGVDILNDPCPINLKSGHSIEIILLLSTDFPEKVELILEWEDDYSLKNRENQFIQLL